MSYTAAVITVSDLGSRGLRQDTSGPAVAAMLAEAGFTVTHTAMVPDEQPQISAELCRCADELGIALIVTTGGTGLSPRDVTPAKGEKEWFLWKPKGWSFAIRRQKMQPVCLITVTAKYAQNISAARQKSLRASAG